MSKELLDRIIGGQTKSDAKAIARDVIQGKVDIDELMGHFFSDDWVICQKVAWPVGMIADFNPQLLVPYIGQMLENLERPVHDAVIRNTIRTWQFMDIPEDWEGPIYDKCFDYFSNPKYPVAFRVFAMTVCTDIAMKHPSLAQEIIPIIEDNWDNVSAAWRARGKKELKRLRSVT